MTEEYEKDMLDQDAEQASMGVIVWGLGMIAFWLIALTLYAIFR